MGSRALSLTLAYNLRFYRAEKGISQSELSSLARITTRNYQNIEGGKANPTLDTLYAIASALEITASKLISLDIIKLEQPIESFIDKFKKNFETSRVSASLRNHEGYVLYRNQKFKRIYEMPELENGQVDLLNVLHPEAKEILRIQLAAERRGMANPYVNFANEANGAQKVFYRFYPCLVFPKQGRISSFSAMYITEISEDHQNGYYEFCRLMLKCIN